MYIQGKKYLRGENLPREFKDKLRNEYLPQLKDKIESLGLDIRVSYWLSDTTESSYLKLVKKGYLSLLISIRNHELQKDVDKEFKISDFNSWGDLEKVLVVTVMEFDWEEKRIIYDKVISRTTGTPKQKELQSIREIIKKDLTEQVEMTSVKDINHLLFSNCSGDILSNKDRIRSIKEVISNYQKEPVYIKPIESEYFYMVTVGKNKKAILELNDTAKLYTV